MRNRKQIDCHISIQYVPLPPEKEAAWWAGMSLLMELLREQPTIGDKEVKTVDTKAVASANFFGSIDQSP